MKKLLIYIMLAATGFAAHAQTSFLQDGKGESAYKLLGNAVSVNTTATSLSSSINVYNEADATNSHFKHWGINFDLAATDGLSTLKSDDGFLFNGGIGAFYAWKKTSSVVSKESGWANEWYVSGKFLSEQNKLYDQNRPTDQAFDKGSVGWKLAGGHSGYRGNWLYGYELNLGQATNAKELKQLTVATLQNGSTDSVKLFKEQTAFASSSFKGNQFNVQLNADIAYGLTAQRSARDPDVPALYAAFHFRYKTFQLSKPQFNPAIGLYIANPGKPRSISAGFNVQESDLFNVLDAKESSFSKRIGINVTAGFNF